MKRNKNSAYVEWNRNWVVVRRHAPIVLKSLLSSVLSLIIWDVLIIDFDFFSKESNDAILSIGIELLAIVYAIFGGYALNSVFTDYKEVSKAILRNDVDTFLLYRDERLPILIHLLLGTTSVLLVVFCMLFKYHTKCDGVVVISSVTFLLAITYFVVRELDNYYESIWFKEKIPKEWYKIDPIEYFKDKNKTKIISQPE